MCTDPGCGLVFKTLQTINRFIVRPVTPDELAESLHEKQELPPVRLKNTIIFAASGMRAAG